MSRKKCQKTKKTVARLDFFGTPFQFRLPHGGKTKRSWQGACSTILIGVALVWYAVNQLIKLIYFKNNTIMVSTQDSFFGPEYEFSTQNDGLMLAFALTNYENDQEPIEEEQYGTLKAYYKYWGLIGDKYEPIRWESVPITTCTPE